MRHIATRGTSGLGVLTVVACALVPATIARAQAVTRLTPSITAMQVYDSNLFSTPGDRQGDAITRITPSLGIECRTPLWHSSGRYALDIERYGSHADLTTMDARQRGTLSLDYRPTPRLTASSGAELWDTNTPGELNRETGLTFGRARARRVSGYSTISRKLTPSSSGTIGYTFADDRMGRAFRARTHSARVAAERALSPRVTATLGYEIHAFSFRTRGAAVQRVMSHALAASWSRAVTDHVRLTLSGGPRLTGTSVAPQWAVAGSYGGREIGLSLAFGRSQTTVVGLAGPADTQTLTATAAWQARRSLRIQVSPGILRNRIGPLRADVLRASVDLVQQLNAHVALELAVDSSVQRGTLYAFARPGSIPRHAAFVQFVAAMARR